MQRRNLLCYSTVAGLVLSYFSTLLFQPSAHSKIDCGIFADGKGLNADGQPFQDFSSFFPYYVCEHQKPRTKLFHFVATTNMIGLWSFMVLTSQYTITTPLLGLLQGYGLAWISHFFIEMNKPATWQYPVWSFMGDFVMFSESLRGEYVLWE